MKHVLFITGTDTGVGKTMATGSLLHALRRHGVNAATMKPVQTGAIRMDNGWRTPDLEVHFAAAGLHVDTGLQHLMAPYNYEPACSPHLAGRLAGSYPQIPHILECAQMLLDSFDALLVEGAGGLLAPLDETHSMLDLIEAFDCPVVVVARTGLGTINHTLLTLGALGTARERVAGVLFNQVEPPTDEAIERDNPEFIVRQSGVSCLGVLRHRPTADWDAWAAELTGVEQLRALLQ